MPFNDLLSCREWKFDEKWRLHSDVLLLHALLNGHSFITFLTKMIFLLLKFSNKLFYMKKYPACTILSKQATHLTKNFFFPLDEFIEAGIEVERESTCHIWKAQWREREEQKHIVEKYSKVSSHINHHAWIGNDKKNPIAVCFPR